MIIRSKTLGTIITIVIFGGIIGAAALGMWKTESGRNAARLQIGGSVDETFGGEMVGGKIGTVAYDPAAIRGNHQFDLISNKFDIPLESLCRAFALPVDVDHAAFRSQDFETIYPEFEHEQEIGNGSLKWFVALYTGLPYELVDDDEDTYLLLPAVDILKNHADLTAEQIAYLDAYTIEMEIEPVDYSLFVIEPQTSNEVTGDIDRKQDKMQVARKTTFADLLEWGVPVEQIEAIIGSEIPNRLMLIYDYCAENNLGFGKIKAALQDLSDNVE